MTWLVGRKVDMSGQAEQELVKILGGKDEREVTGKIGRWEVGGTQDVGWYVYSVRKEKENDVEEEKEVGKKVDACTQTVEAIVHENDGVQFQKKEVGECLEHKDCWGCDEKVGSMRGG